ncbi:hypothetical protein NU219Hw_g6565t1 [Hortaea werneckii]
MTFLNRLFEDYTGLSESGDTESRRTLCFLHQLFLYNDLVQSTSTETTPLWCYYLKQYFKESASTDADSLRYHFPNLITRISTGDWTVTDEDIDNWQGGFDWFPIFALDPVSTTQLTVANDLVALAQLYRTSAKIYRVRMSTSRSLEADMSSYDASTMTTGLLASEAVRILQRIPEGSPCETALLWPIGIAAKELQKWQATDRCVITARLQNMEHRFKMRHFCRAQDALHALWRSRDMIEAFEINTDRQSQELSAPATSMLG